MIFNRKPEKTPQQRINEAINHIGTLHAQLSFEIENKTRSQVITVGRDISIERPYTTIDKDKRVALRALLLCQRCYFSNLWSPTFQLDDSWKTDTINYWKSRSRNEINRAIMSFTSSSNTATSLANVAEAAGNAPGGNDRNYRFSRNEPINMGSGTCYVAIKVWLLKSGLVSYPWYLRHISVTSVTDVKNAFGTPISIWNSPNQTFGMISQLPPVPRGYIVYINYFQEVGFGHWMVSLGNGLAAGCNNNLTGGGTVGFYSNSATLDSQFYHGFNMGNATGTPRGIAYMFDPTAIPNRHML